uniref:NADP-dependent oxidoreductase domain-containing protein n=1 Tax=Leersia perrieri TaxID=77586 RepID=A0A0D9W5K2_9ORYZ
MASPGSSGRCSSRSRVPEFRAGPSGGRGVPAVGLGTASARFMGEDDFRVVLLAALEVGYRHIDTASVYGSERVVGEGVADAVRRGVLKSREEVFVTTKVWCTQCHPDLVELNPVWQQKKLLEFCKEKGIHVTAYHPLGGKYKTSTVNPVMNSDVLKEIAEAKGKSVAQISLRWIYEQGASMLTTSTKRERLKENIEIFDWQLSDDDRLKISQIPQHKKVSVLSILCPDGVSSVELSEVDVVEA